MSSKFIILLLVGVCKAVSEPTCEIGCPSISGSVTPSLLQVVSHRRVRNPIVGEESSDDAKVDVEMEIQTCTSDYAGTETGASVSFQIAGQWTQTVEVVKQVPSGGLINRKVRLSHWPSRVRIQAGGPDAWCYDSIVFKNGDFNTTVLKADPTNSSHEKRSRHWVDTDDQGSSVNEYTVPPLPGTSVNKSHNCTTRFDSRIESMGYATAPEGTPCVFGLDPRDEGGHCIYEDGIYGSFGWCYTDDQLQTWGSCSETCPLFGQHSIIGKKIDKVLEKLAGQPTAVTTATTATTTTTNMLSVEAVTTAAPATTATTTSEAALPNPDPFTPAPTAANTTVAATEGSATPSNASTTAAPTEAQGNVSANASANASANSSTAENPDHFTPAPPPPEEANESTAGNSDQFTPAPPPPEH